MAPVNTQKMPILERIKDRSDLAWFNGIGYLGGLCGFIPLDSSVDHGLSNSSQEIPAMFNPGPDLAAFGFQTVRAPEMQ